MELVRSFDFKTSPMKAALQDPNTLMDHRDSFHFQQGRVTPDVPMFSSLLPSIPTADDLEPVPIGTYKNPYYHAAQQAMLKESVEFLFGSSSLSKQEDGGAMRITSKNNNNKKRKREDTDDFLDDDSCGSSRSDSLRFRPYQNQQWGDRFEDLKEFRRTNGHCSVPYDYPPNPSLARWVKRQRYQFQLFNKGQPSAMTEERILALIGVGFVWDTCTAAWERRISELRTFQAVHGHANVPSTYQANKKLAAWVKVQRRQYKLFTEGKESTLTFDRIDDLNELDFQWEIRGSKQ